MQTLFLAPYPTNKTVNTIKTQGHQTSTQEEWMEIAGIQVDIWKEHTWGAW